MTTSSPDADRESDEAPEQRAVGVVALALRHPRVLALLTVGLAAAAGKLGLDPGLADGAAQTVVDVVLIVVGAVAALAGGQAVRARRAARPAAAPAAGPAAPEKLP